MKSTRTEIEIQYANGEINKSLKHVGTNKALLVYHSARSYGRLRKARLLDNTDSLFMFISVPCYVTRWKTFLINMELPYLIHLWGPMDTKNLLPIYLLDIGN